MSHGTPKSPLADQAKKVFFARYLQVINDLERIGKVPDDIEDMHEHEDKFPTIPLRPSGRIEIPHRLCRILTTVEERIRQPSPTILLTKC